MRKLFAVLVLLFASATIASAQQGFIVVPTCPGAHYGGLFTGAGTVDSNGRFCIQGTFSATVSYINGIGKDTIIQMPGMAPSTALYFKCDSACGGGGGSGDSVNLDTVKVVKVQWQTDSVLRVDTVRVANIYTPAGDTITVRAVQRSGDTLFVRTLQRSGDTLVVKGNFSACTSAAPCYNKIDSVPLTTGGSIDTVRIVKKAIDSIFYMPAVTIAAGSNAKIGNVGDSIYYPLTAGRVKTADSIVYIPPGGYNDSTVLVAHLRWVDSLKLLDSATVVHQVTISQTRVTDTVSCAVGGKSVADSVILPSYGGSTYQYITWYQVAGSDTLTITGTGPFDTLTTTNFPGGGILQRWGNACALGAVCGPNNGNPIVFANPVKVLAAATATKFRVSTLGTGGYAFLCVGYYHQ